MGAMLKLVTAALRADRPLLAALVSAATVWSFGAGAVAASADTDPDCVPTQRDEKSIVIAVGEIDPADPSLAIITDRSEEECGLEPIARTTGAEPELAETPVAAAPTPADPPGQGALAGADYGGAQAEYDLETDDVGADDDLAENEPGVDELGAMGETIEIHAASFNGVTPGVSTREDVVVEWGEPAVQDRGRLTYQFDHFPRVEAKIAEGVVASIRVVLAEPAELEPLVAQLGLSPLRGVAATDHAGVVVSTTFPERGVTLLQQPEGQQAFASDDPEDVLPTSSTAVYEIELAGITAAPFARRALAAAPRAYTQQMADLEEAIRLDGSAADTRFYLSQVKRAAGEVLEAERLAGEAVKLDETSDAYRLHWARCLADLARYDAAVEETRKVLESPATTKLVRAEALNQMGHLAALGSKEVQSRAVPLHSKAIELADQLANDADDRVARAANLLLVDAHLAVAQRIAIGDWQEKDDTIAQWIARASAIAERLIADGEADESLRLKVAVSALHAGAKLDPPINPELWIAEAEESAALLGDACDDDLAIAEVDWQLALAYCCATEIQHRRGQPESALAYGEQADQLMVTLTGLRSDLPDTAYVQGRLYFQIGAVHAVHLDDHKEACRWYKKAVDPLLAATPVTPLVQPGQHGDALVSMGVSYWQVGQRDRAYELTEAGLKLIQQGVAEGILDVEAVKVPESNLAAMGRVLGKVDLTVPEAGPAQQQVAQQKPPTPQKSNAGATASQPQRRVASRRTRGGILR